MAAKHAQKFYVRVCNKSALLVDDFPVYAGSIYGRYTNANGNAVFWVCDSYALIDGKLPIHIHDGNHWKFCLAEADHPCYKWVKIVIGKLGRIPKVDRENLRKNDYANLMKHDSLHKKGSGSRINTHQINQPLRWREVTEIAHWYGKGNASVVASNIRL